MMEDWDNPAYPFTTFELRGGLHVRRRRVGDGELVTFVVGGREVSCPLQPDDCRLPDGASLPYSGTWFWSIDCEFTPLPYGPYSTQWEAEYGARQTVVELAMFELAKLKIKRADHHIDDLKGQLRAFTRQCLDTSIQNPNGGTFITLTVLKPPDSIAPTIGDAIHNLRTSLDHLTWKLNCIYRGRQDRRIQFPMGRNKTKFESACNDLKALPKTVIEFLQSLQAFPGGDGQLLYVIHDLDNADKHRILTPTVNAPTIDELVLVSDGGKVRRPLSDLYGSSAQLERGETFTIDGAPAGSSLDFKNDEISPHILFGDVDIVNVALVKNQPIFPMVLQLRHAVSNVIDIAAKAIS